MNVENNAFVLASREDDAPNPVLTGVKAEGRLDGVLRRNYAGSVRIFVFEAVC